MGPFNPTELWAALQAVPASAWSLPSTFEATKVHHGYRRAVLAEICDQFGWVLESFAPVRDAWLSWIDPGGFIVSHRDAGPYYERWQVPVSTAGWTDQGSPEPSTDGEPFRVAHWLPHSVGNPTARPRVHLVLDRDVLVGIKPQPFALFPE